MAFQLRILALTVIIIKDILGMVAIPAQQGQGTAIHSLHPFAATAQGYHGSSADEQGELVQVQRHPVMSRSHGQQIVILRRAEADHEHIFRQIHMPPPGVLLVNRGNHAFAAQHHLILRSAGSIILWIVESQRPEEHFIIEGSLHKLAVQVGQQSIANRQHPAHVIHPAEAVNFLIPGVLGRMVAHQGRKDPQLQPAEQQVFRGVLPKASQISTIEKEAAHVQGGQLLQVQQDVAPPGAIVSLPNAAVAVRSYVGGTAEQQIPLICLIGFKAFRRRSGHVVAVQIVHPVVADGLSVHHMIEPAVILHVVRRLLKHTLQMEAFLHPQVLPLAAFRQLNGFLQGFLRVEEGRLVHVVPEAFNPHIQQLEVLPAEPRPHFRTQKVREIAVTGPYCTHEGFPVCLQAEIALLQSLIAHIITLFLLHPGINNGHQADMLLPHFTRQLGQVGKMALVPGKILEPLHVVNVHADTIQRNMPGAMFPDDGADFILRSVAPAGLNVAKRPLGRQIALTNDAAECMDNVLQAILFDQVNADISLRAGNNRLITVCVAQVKHHIAGIIKVHAEKAAYPCKDQQIVAAVQALPSLMMVGIIRIPGTITEPPFIDAPHVLPQTENHVIFPQVHREAECFPPAGCGHMGQDTLPHGNRDNHCICRDGGTKVISANHEKNLPLIDLFPGTKHLLHWQHSIRGENFPAGGIMILRFCAHLLWMFATFCSNLDKVHSAWYLNGRIICVDGTGTKTEQRICSSRF